MIRILNGLCTITRHGGRGTYQNAVATFLVSFARTTRQLMQSKSFSDKSDDWFDFPEDDLVVISDNSHDKLDYTSTRYNAKKRSIITTDDDEQFLNDVERDANAEILYPKGTPNGFYIVKEYNVPSSGFLSLGDDISESMGIITAEEISRLDICPKNITLPIALMLLDKDEYPSLSRARKACRKGYITIRRHDTSKGDTQQHDEAYLIRGRVADRVFPGDIIGRQVRMHGGFYPTQATSKPPFDLPVIYQDDHFAIVNKPAGVVVYSQRKQGHGLMTVRAALPFVLQPPKRGVLSIIRRPASVHRLDKPTSGLLLVAKTKPAMVDLTRQFVERKIKKTYSAVLNGIPSEPVDTSLTSKQAFEMGADVDPSSDVKWQLIDSSLDEKSAVTLWRPVKYSSSLVAKDGTLTQVEMKLLTGRYHQLRRHFAWTKDCPLVGDKIYDGGGDAMKLRGRGLFLCSNKVLLDHPYYNTVEGRTEWDMLNDDNDEKYAGGRIYLDKTQDIVKVSCEIELPLKFTSLMEWEEDRVNKFECLAAYEEDLDDGDDEDEE
jgi:23S rRNA-/tRNA-specific pseudouridylate synthase